MPTNRTAYMSPRDARHVLRDDLEDDAVGFYGADRRNGR